MKYIFLVFYLLVLGISAQEPPLVYKEVSQKVFEAYKGAGLLLKQKAIDTDIKPLKRLHQEMEGLLKLAYEIDDVFLPSEYKKKSKHYLKEVRASQQSLSLYDDLIKKYILESMKAQRVEVFDALIVYAHSAIQKDRSFQEEVISYYASENGKRNTYLDTLIKYSSAEKKYSQTNKRSSVYAKSEPKTLIVNTHTQSFLQLEEMVSKLQREDKLPKKMAFISRVGKSRNVDFFPLKSRGLSKRGTSHQNLQCFENNHLDALVGNDLNNKVYCGEKTKWILGGKGDDELNIFGRGLQVISPGLGNDTIMHISSGVIIVMNKNWGHDEISHASGNSDFLPDKWHSKRVAHEDLKSVLKTHAIAKPSHWKYRYTNFIVFGRGVSPYDLEIDEYSIKNIKTGDSIEFEYRPRYNLVFVDSPLITSAF